MLIPPDGALNFRRALPGLYRSGNLSFLSEQGRVEMLALNLSRILDLRTRAERHIDAPPFVGRAEYLNLSLLSHCVRELNEASLAGSNGVYNCAVLDYGANNIVSILGALLDAPPGPVLIHCHAGKDRTGLIAALCLELAGFSRDEIAADYVATGPELVDFYARGSLRRTPEHQRRDAPFIPTVVDDILRPLAHLNSTWSGVAPYLAAYGFSQAEQAALGRRLMKG
ncbi:tyrosine-protein phosphatase [Deinococcus sp. AJ005]|uniref:tyrosine-protein phosphatase n=1 Tax=Deinococcus sp. AJ005 TaxID=2652443 RepID=UPI00125CCE05|nr:tyrosine-protein phosphatase [Deinococcus sp. AJ005]QFP77054.1 tyrosine-protein phosphatase [Deinococcus sp. AJ005]